MQEWCKRMRKESLDDVPNTKRRHRELGWKTLSPSVTLDRFPSQAPAVPYTSIPPIYSAITATETIGSLGSISTIRLSKIEPRTNIPVHRFAFTPDTRSYVQLALEFLLPQNRQLPSSASSFHP